MGRSEIEAVPSLRHRIISDDELRHSIGASYRSRSAAWGSRLNEQNTDGTTGRKSPTESITVYVDPSIRRRARAAYTSTAAIENDRSWSEFVAVALLHEAQLREERHNGCQPFRGGEGLLKPGRKRKSPSSE